MVLLEIIENRLLLVFGFFGFSVNHIAEVNQPESGKSKDRFLPGIRKSEIRQDRDKDAENKKNFCFAHVCIILQ